MPKKQHKEPVKMRKLLPRSNRYIITAAQNATPIHEGFWKALNICAEFYDAEIIVIPGRYKNPTSQWTQANQGHEWWDPVVEPYLFDGRRKLTNRLIILGDVKVQWAAAMPLSRMDALSKGMSGIVGHGSRALRSIATPQHKHPKLMMTTGACTMRGNYTDTKAGILGDFNHCLGGLIVETDGDVFYARQLNAVDASGSFIDLDMEFTSEGVRRADPALALSLADAHHRFMLKSVEKATFSNKSSLVKLTKPKHLFWHDVLDFHTRNHHHKDDWLSAYGKWTSRKECVRTEVEEAVCFVERRTPKGSKSIVVSSNHDRALARWLKEANFKTDPVNAEFYLELALQTLRTTKLGQGGIEYADPFSTYASKLSSKKVRYLRQGQSFVLSNVEYGLHGDNGPNGARGTTKNLSTIGIKVTKGHSHAAEIIDGCYSGGKCTGPLEYENGSPSAHSNSHVIQYANGKRAIIFIINGRYRLPYRMTNHRKTMLLD